jgi:hypothetical protein
MKRFFVLIGSLLLVSCAALPAIRLQTGSDEKSIVCPSPFLTEKTRLIHAIEVRAAGRAQTVIIGVTLADPALRTLSCALMSTEGMAFFEAASEPDGLKVSRALPPFDAGDFASNMMNDIDLIFFAPRGVLIQKGVLAEGNPVCRWQREQGGWIDVSKSHDGQIHIRRYAEDGNLKRSVLLDAKAADPYSTLELQASEMVDYTLMMTLIESETVKDEPQMTEKRQGAHP